jgi:hypothetical protein
VTRDAVFLTVVGVILGAAASYVFYRLSARRLRLVIDLAELVAIDPTALDVKVEMKIGTLRPQNLVLLELSVTNRGPRDLVVSDAADPQTRHLRPRIELPVGVTALADPWNPAGVSPQSDVRVARSLVNGVQQLHVHVHRLASGQRSSARILCTCSYPPGLQDAIAQDGVAFFTGFLADADIQGSGLLRPPATALTS